MLRAWRQRRTAPGRESAMRNKRAWFAVPYVGWMALFVVAPILLVVVYAFTAANGGFTLENFSHMGAYATAFTRSFKLAIIATLVCLAIGYPVAYMISRESARFQRIAMMLVMLPMWMNFLLRTYAWMSILENTGLLNRLFAATGLIDLGNLVNGGLNRLCESLNDGIIAWCNARLGVSWALYTTRNTSMEYFQMINTQGAVVLGMVYNYLPFMILPIYSVIEKLDGSLLEAARDLGANSLRVFRKVIFPLSLPGVLSGITMVFVPSVSTFAISKLLGGSNELLLGDLIEQQFLGTAYNPYLGSAIALVMMVIVVVCMAVMNRFGEGEEQAVLL